MKRDYKILIDRSSRLHNLICKYFNKREEVCFRQSSKDKRDKEAKELINEAHIIIKNTIAEDFGWKHWDIKYERVTVRDMRLHQVTLYVQEHIEDLL